MIEYVCVLVCDNCRLYYKDWDESPSHLRYSSSKKGWKNKNLKKDYCPQCYEKLRNKKGVNNG